MKDIFEIRKAHENELFSIAEQRIESFPTLKKIYDDKFLINLVRRKNDYDNLLLLWLVIDDPIAHKLFEDIEEDFDLFHSKGSFNVLKKKFRQWNTVSFEAAITELEFATEYFRKGYQIKLEPNLPNNRKGDFCASKGTAKIYFEVKMVYNEASNEDQTIMNELSDRFSRMDQHFRISIDIKENFKPSQTVKV